MGDAARHGAQRAQAFLLQGFAQGRHHLRESSNQDADLVTSLGGGRLEIEIAGLHPRRRLGDIADRAGNGGIEADGNRQSDEQRADYGKEGKAAEEAGQLGSECIGVDDQIKTADIGLGAADRMGNLENGAVEGLTGRLGYLGQPRRHAGPDVRHDQSAMRIIDAGGGDLFVGGKRIEITAHAFDIAKGQGRGEIGGKHLGFRRELLGFAQPVFVAGIKQDRPHRQQLHHGAGDDRDEGQFPLDGQFAQPPHAAPYFFPRTDSARSRRWKLMEMPLFEAACWLIL